MDITLIEEAIPKIVRQGGTGREAEKWEEGLAPLKGKEMAGKSYRVFSAPLKSSVQSRMNTMRGRLNKVAPTDNFEMKVRPVPDTNDFGLYVQYNGTFTPEQLAEIARKRSERSERTKASKPLAAVPNGTAKERVAAAHKAKAS